VSRELKVTGDLTVSYGSTLTPLDSPFRLDLSGSLIVQSGATLDVSGIGYPGGDSTHPTGFAPSGVAGAGVEYGGSHGGPGAAWNATSGEPGELFDSVYYPVLAGGGGGQDHDGTGDGLPGGGVLEILAQSVHVDGTIRADGGPSDDQGRPAGAGGSIWIDAATLTGAGTISADGGFARTCTYARDVGAGGGGRVVLSVDDLTGFDVATQASASGGRLTFCSGNLYQCAAPGTVLSYGASASLGELWVLSELDCLIKPIGATQLPTIGSGTVGVADVDTTDATDLWIEPQDAGTTFSLGTAGMWVRVNGSDYPVIDQSADRRRLLLDGAAGLVSVGDAYQGVYKFDSVIVRGGAVLEFLDTADVVTYDVDADSQVITP